MNAEQDLPVTSIRFARDEDLDLLAAIEDDADRGHGAALVRAVLTEVGRRGCDQVTLDTPADVPWNAPFYARLGFVETGPVPDPSLERWGRRVRMSASSGVRGAR